MKAKFSETTKVRKAKQVQWKSVNGEAVLLHFANGNYFALDPVGTHLWSSLCRTSLSIGDLIESVSSEYDCSGEDARRDTLEFCGQLLAERLLEIHE